MNLIFIPLNQLYIGKTLTLHLYDIVDIFFTSLTVYAFVPDLVILFTDLLIHFLFSGAARALPRAGRRLRDAQVEAGGKWRERGELS